MSASLLNDVPPHWHFAPCARFSASGVYHASAPDVANKSTTFLFTAGSFSGFLQLVQTKTAMGTPHTRWREMHQSGRVSTILEMRSSPHGGSHFTFLISSSERVRNVPLPIGVSMEMNHCSVARKITGLWQRQQWGYECSTFSSCSRAPRDFSNSMMAGFALKTCKPSYSGNPL